MKLPDLNDVLGFFVIVPVLVLLWSIVAATVFTIFNTAF